MIGIYTVIVIALTILLSSCLKERVPPHWTRSRSERGEEVGSAPRTPERKGRMKMMKEVKKVKKKKKKRKGKRRLEKSKDQVDFHPLSSRPLNLLHTPTQPQCHRHHTPTQPQSLSHQAYQSHQRGIGEESKK